MPKADTETMSRLLGFLPSGTQADARISRDRFVTMRFANGRVHQPHFETSVVVSLRVALAGRIATATTCDLSIPGLRAVVHEATSLALVAPKEPRFMGFAHPSDPPPHPTDFSSRTGEMSPE
ncbi:MAG: hypothetical protein L3J96_06720, partial [Thermoplasmata archaeon]|nr:hypothetical protein [Thermoplasmata archaeon]